MTIAFAQDVRVAAAIDQSVAGVMLQFSFGNCNLVDRWFWREQTESLQGRAARKERENENNGSVQFIMSTANVGVRAFILELQAAGFVMTDALAQERANQKNKGRTYFAVRFVFHKEPLTRPLTNEWATILKNHCESSLDRLCKEAMWRVRAYRNPLHHEKSVGRFGLSVNFEARSPYRNGDGTQVTRWQKDVSGERIGEKPTPITPDAYLRLIDDRIVIE